MNKTDIRDNNPGNNRAIIYSAIFLLIVSAGCVNKKPSDNPERSVKFDQYFVQGKQLYIKNCSNCHQKEGTGLGLIYPPLKNSDYLLQNRNDVICLIRNGRTGELVVNGKTYNQAMPPSTLSDLEIAEIATYIYNSWGRERGILEVSKVAVQLQQCDSIPARD